VHKMVYLWFVLVLIQFASREHRSKNSVGENRTGIQVEENTINETTEIYMAVEIFK